MIEQSVVRSVLVVALVVGALGVTGQSSTSGHFTDDHNGTAALTADKFNGGGGNFPQNAVAYDDSKPQNSNWKHNEDTYTAQDLTDCCQGNPNFRFHASAGTVTNSDTNIEAARITSESGVDFQAGTFRLLSDSVIGIGEFGINSDSVDVQATGADATLTNVSIDRAGPVNIVATNGGHVRASGLTTTSTDALDIYGTGVGISNSEVEANSVDVQATGADATLTGATIDGDGSVTINDTGGGEVVAPRLNIDTIGMVTITVSGNNIDLSNATINTTNHVTITATENHIDLRNATIETDAAIEIRANGGTIDVRGATCKGSSVLVYTNGGEIQGEGQCESGS